MAVTLAQVLDNVQAQVSDDATEFSDADLTQVIYDAIREYSQHFPRIQSTTQACTTGHPSYSLPADLIGIVEVQYPSGEDPPEYKTRLDRQSEYFWDSDDYYDVELEGEGGGTIYMSEDVATGNSIAITYTAWHDTSLLTTDNLSVPEHHIPLIIAYAVWQCYARRLAEEMDDPDTTIHLIRDMQESVTEHRLAYERKLARALKSHGQSRITKGWVMDGSDPIY
jgi:hypothetical protein